MFHVERSCFPFGMYSSTIDFRLSHRAIWRRISEDSRMAVQTAFHVERANRDLGDLKPHVPRGTR
jgi:hypothetical protein